jgi:predicted small lipoprotein YifL
MLRRSAAALLAMAVAGLIASCGIKGPLKLPPAQQSAPTPAAPASQPPASADEPSPDLPATSGEKKQ